MSRYDVALTGATASVPNVLCYPLYFDLRFFVSSRKSISLSLAQLTHTLSRYRVPSKRSKGRALAFMLRQVIAITLRAPHESTKKASGRPFSPPHLKRTWARRPMPALV